jgi:peptidoglycan-binding protein ArfA
MPAVPLSLDARTLMRSALRAAQVFATAALLIISTGCGQQPGGQVAQARHTSPVPKTEAWLTVANNSGRYHFEGVVGDEATRASLLRSLESVYGGDAQGTIAIDPNTHPAPWVGELDKLFLVFRVPGGMLDFRGKRIELSGAVPDENRAALLRKARELYPDHALAGLFEGVDANHTLPEADNNAALLAFLNRIPISFQADSGVVTPDSLDGLSRAARAIQAADKALRLQVGVQPERSDMPDYDRDIAFQRANSVKVQLAIRGIGPGRLDSRVLDGDPAGKPGRVQFALAEVVPRDLARAVPAAANTRPGNGRPSPLVDAQATP